MEQTYADRRNSLIETLADLAASFERHDAIAEASATHALAKKLAEERFNVVVVGAFKRGKSTLVNALLGADVLPTGAIPLTSVVTCVGWGAEPHLQIAFTDGRVEDVPAGSIARYVTEAGNPGNELGVERVVLTDPSEGLADGIFLVDTPGIESVHLHNTAAARAVLPEIDAAIFVTSADPPISEAERTFLEEVRAVAPRVFVVLNKIDHVPAPDRSETVAFTRDVVRRSLGGDPDLYPTSARLATEAGPPEARERSGIEALERDLRALLVRDKGDVLLESTRRRTVGLIEARSDALLVEERLLSLSQEARSEAAARLDEVFSDAARARDDLATLLSRDVQRLVREVERDLAAFSERETTVLEGEAASWMDAEEGNDPDAAELWMERVLQRDVEAWRVGEDALIADAFESIASRAVEQVDELATRTAELAGGALGLTLHVSATPIDLRAAAPISYRSFETPTILGSLLPGVQLSRRMARRKLERTLAARIPTVVDRSCGRIRYEVVTRLEDGRRQLEKSVAARLDAVVEAIRRASDRATEELRGGSERVAARRRAIEAERRELQVVRARMDAAGG